MHQRPPADPYGKDELVMTSTAPATMTMAMTQAQAQTDTEGDDLAAGMDGADGYHGVAEDEVADRTDTESSRRHAPDLFDDVFGGDDDDGDDNGTSAPAAAAASDARASSEGTGTAARTHAHPSDMHRLQQEHSTAGYRDGLTAGKNASLQAGFDEGYSLGAALGLVVGELLGLLEGLQGFSSSRTSEADQLGAAAAATAAAAEDSAALLARARRDLAMPSIYAPAYFAPDGTWLYEVVGEDNASATIFDVARAHPLVAAWRDTVDKELSRRGVRWARPGEEAALAAVLGLSEDEPTAAAAAAREPKKVAAAAAAAAAASPAEPTARVPPSSTSALDW